MSHLELPDSATQPSWWRAQPRRIAESLLTGVSYMIPFVVAGGILIAIAFGIGGIYVSGQTGFAADLFAVGKIGMTLMTAVLGGYIAYSLADRPGLVGGFVAGTIAGDQGSGFLGAMIGGLFTGYLVMGLKKIKLPYALHSMLPVLIIPLLSVLAVFVFMYYLIGVPVAALNTALISGLNNL